MKKHKFSSWSHLYLLPVALLLIFVIAGCTQGASTEPSVTDQPTLTKTWTVLAYVCADNNLDEAGTTYGWQVLNNMEMAGSNDSVNVVVQFDHTGANAGKAGAQRYYITRNPDAKIGEVKSPMLEDLGKTNMGNPDTLVNFVEWGMKNYPANKYAVILWNHGGGWRNVGDNGSIRGIIYDDSSNDHLTEAEVGEAFQRIYTFNDSKKLEFIGFDACLMASVEVCDDLKNFGKYYVSSERSEWAPGWPYQYFLNDLRSDPSYDGKVLSAVLVTRYAQYNQERGFNDYTLAGATLDKTTDMTGAVDQFAQSAIDNIDAEAANLQTADGLTPSVSDSYPDFKDLKLFMDNVITSVGTTDLIDKANEVNTSLSNLVLYRTQGSSLVEPRGGLSIWLPSQTYYSTYITEYRKLNFAKDTNWDDFLDIFMVQ